jgi:hypothetical protein
MTLARVRGAQFDTAPIMKVKRLLE